MPIYEYECQSCKHRFEELVSTSSDEMPECPECRQKEVKKLMSAGSFKANSNSTGSLSVPAPSCAPTGG